jgi:hypothetical protein
VSIPKDSASVLAKDNDSNTSHHLLQKISKIMSKQRPPNGPSTTGKPSGGGRGSNPPAPKPAPPPPKR